MARITKLTAEQQADLSVHREHWREIGLSTQPADFDKAKEAITWIYENKLGKPAPMFLCFSSPMMCVLAIAAIRQLAKGARKGPLSKIDLSSQLSSQLVRQLSSQIDSQLYSQLSSQLYSQLSSQLDSQLDSQIDSQLYSQLVRQLYSQLYSQLDSQLYSQLVRQLYSQLYSQIDSQLYSQLDSQLVSQLDSQLVSKNLRDAWGSFYRSWMLSGQSTVSWVAFHTFAAKIGVKYEPEVWKFFQAWATLGESCSWWMAYDGLCIISDRPRTLSFDAERRLHSETGAAIAFSDGWGVHAWHGTRIPAEWIEDKASLTAKTALTWKNIEQRRSACEILGWNAVLTELKAKTIDKDAEPEIGELVEVTIPDVGKERFLRVVCGTGRSFALPVPPDMKTALQAQAWTWGLDDKTFGKPEVRT